MKISSYKPELDIRSRPTNYVDHWIKPCIKIEYLHDDHVENFFIQNSARPKIANYVRTVTIGLHLALKYPNLGFSYEVNDMQPPSLLSKMAVFNFWSKMTHNVLKLMKNPFPNFYFFRYNHSKIWFFLSNWLKKAKRSAMFWTSFLSSQVFFCAMISFWDLVNLEFYLCNAFKT